MSDEEATRPVKVEPDSVSATQGLSDAPSASGRRRAKIPPPPQGGSRQALAQLALVLAVVVVAAIATHTTDLLVVIAALVIMVMLHELGHFATAKWSHMKVTEYFFGFGPRLWSVRKGETEYGIKAIPAGGYVKILGMSNTEEVDPWDEPRTYREQPFHNRLIVAVAGSAMHAVMAFCLIWGLLVFVGTPATNVVSISALSSLAHGVDPARSAGLKKGDVVERVDGKRITSPNQLVDLISASAGRRVTIVVERDGKLLTLVVTPVATASSQGSSAGAGSPSSSRAVGRIGVEIGGGPDRRSGPLVAVGRSVEDLGRTITSSVSALGQVFSPHGISSYFHDLTSSAAADKAAKSGQRIESIYGAVRTATQGAQAGVVQLVEVLVAINVFVGMLNLLPMLPLDGGHVAVAVYERVRSRRGRRYHADVNKLMPVAYAFVLFLGFIVVTSLYLDITHPVANPFR
ncbi:MAG TPA: site-2 protease family protein [Acidimicrobiales bacterium]|nr:site-2 protease family protein [Acidimicrobiales bacterium]